MESEKLQPATALSERRHIARLGTTLLLLALTVPLGAAQRPVEPSRETAERPTEEEVERLVRAVYQKYQDYTYGAGAPLAVDILGVEVVEDDELEELRLDDLVTFGMGYLVKEKLNLLSDSSGRQVVILEPDWQETGWPNSREETREPLRAALNRFLSEEAATARAAAFVVQFHVVIDLFEVRRSYQAAAIWYLKETSWQVSFLDPVLRTGLLTATQEAVPPSLESDALARARSLEQFLGKAGTPDPKECFADNRPLIVDLSQSGTEDHYLGGSHSMQGIANTPCACTTDCYSTCDPRIDSFSCGEDDPWWAPGNSPFHFFFTATETGTNASGDGDELGATCNAGAMCKVRLCTLLGCSANIEAKMEFEEGFGLAFKPNFGTLPDIRKFSASAGVGRCQKCQKNIMACATRDDDTPAAVVESPPRTALNLDSDAAEKLDAAEEQPRFCPERDLKDRCRLVPEMCDGSRQNATCEWHFYTASYTVRANVAPEVWVSGVVRVPAAFLVCPDGGFGLLQSSSSFAEKVDGTPLDISGTGPMHYFRTQFEAPVTQNFWVEGVARDDFFGIKKIQVWLDNEPVTLPGFSMKRNDSYTCSEIPASNCDRYSGWRGFVDITGFAPGEHTLQVMAVNNRSTLLEIPVYDEMTFTIPCDTNKPTVSLSTPATGSTVSGTVPVPAYPTDDKSIYLVRWYVDGVSAKDIRNSPGPWVFNWDSTAVSDGSHAIKARAWDYCGNYSNYSNSLSLTVSNNSCDSVLPTAAVISPANGSTVSGAVAVSASATDNAAIAKVEIFLDGFLKYTRSAATGPYIWSWNTNTATNGTHRLSSRSWDNCGNQKTSASVFVTVNNQTARQSTFYPQADAYAKQEQSTSNFGSSVELIARANSGGLGRQAYLRFNVDGLAGRVVSARIRIRSGALGASNVQFHRVQPFVWYESTLNWNNKSNQLLQLQSVSSIPANTWTEIDVTTGVSGNGPNHFAITSAQNSGSNFWSKESTDKPQLIIEWIPD